MEAIVKEDLNKEENKKSEPPSELLPYPFRLRYCPFEVYFSGLWVR
jgi:hypothetical protein